MTETQLVTDLRAHPLNTQVYGSPNLSPEFLQSVIDFGILTPISILPDGTIISGHRRWQAAKELGLTDIPVRVHELTEALDIERAIIESNRQREKTFSQKMREAEELERIEAEIRKRRSFENLRQGDNPPSGSNEPVGESGRTREVVAEAVGLGSGSTYYRAKRVWEAAKSGDEKAQELVKKLDSEEVTISAAAEALTDKPHVSQNSGEYEWYTPMKYIEAARQTMGAIDCDPASSDIANEIVPEPSYQECEVTDADTRPGQRRLGRPLCPPTALSACIRTDILPRRRHTSLGRANHVSAALDAESHPHYSLPRKHHAPAWQEQAQRKAGDDSGRYLLADIVTRHPHLCVQGDWTAQRGSAFQAH